MDDEALIFCNQKNHLDTETFRTYLMNRTNLKRDILFKLHHRIMLKITENSILKQKLKEINNLELTQLIYQVLYKDE